MLPILKIKKCNKENIVPSFAKVFFASFCPRTTVLQTLFYQLLKSTKYVTTG